MDGIEDALINKIIEMEFKICKEATRRAGLNWCSIIGPLSKVPDGVLGGYNCFQGNVLLYGLRVDMRVFENKVECFARFESPWLTKEEIENL